MSHFCPVHDIAGVHQSGPQGGYQLRRDQGLEVKEGEDQVQHVPKVLGSQPVDDVLAVVDELDHVVPIFFSASQYICQ